VPDKKTSLLRLKPETAEKFKRNGKGRNGREGRAGRGKKEVSPSPRN